MIKKLISLSIASAMLCGLVYFNVSADSAPIGTTITIGHDSTSPAVDVQEYTDNGFTDSGTTGLSGNTRATQAAGATSATLGFPDFPRINFAKWRPIPGTTENWGPGKWKVSIYNVTRGTVSQSTASAKVLTYNNDTLSSYSLNQQSGSDWVEVGTFDFTGDGREFIILYKTDGTTYVTADSVKFEKISEYTPKYTAADKIVIDHGTEEYVDVDTGSGPMWGNWAYVGYPGGLTDVPNAYARILNNVGSFSPADAEFPNRYAKWQPTASKLLPGKYKVSIWNTVRTDSGTDSAKAYIKHNGISTKATPTTLLQKAGTNGWVDMGTYEFIGDGNEYVVLYNGGAGGNLIADSVKFERVYPSELTNLAISSGTLSPSFSASTTAYNVNVFTDSINITATATGTLKINGSIATSGVPVNVPLNVGVNSITILIQQADKIDTTYTITATRMSEWSNGNTMIIQHNTATVTVPEYSEAGGNWGNSGVNGYQGEGYIAGSRNTAASSTISNNMPYRYAMWKPIPTTTQNWGPGLYKVEIFNVVRTQADGVDKAIVWLRHNGSTRKFILNQNTGTSGWVDLGTLNPLDESGNPTLAPLSTFDFAGTGQINDDYVLIYKPEDATGTYLTADSVRFTEQISSEDSKLKTFSINGVTTAPVFAPTTYTYNARAFTSSISLNLSPVNPLSNIKINNVTVQQGVNSLPLTLGTNTFEIEVTAPKGDSFKSTYTLNVVRNVKLSEIDIKDDNGITVTDLVGDENINFSVQIENCELDTTATLILALFDGDMLVDTDITALTPATGTQILDCSLRMPSTIKPSYNVKAFLLDSLNNIQPFGDVKSLK